MLKTSLVITLVSLSLVIGSGDLSADPGGGPVRPAAPKSPAKLVLDKAPELTLDTTAGGLSAYVSYFRRRGYTVTLDQELFDRLGKVQIFRFAARQSVRGGSRHVTAEIDVAKHTVTTSEGNEMSYSSKKKS